MPMTPLIRPNDAPTFALPGIDFTGLAAPSRGSSESAVWIVDMAAGTEGTPHQLTREEVLVAVEGRAVATLAGVEYTLEEGGALIVPARVDFALANPFERRFRAVAVLPVGGQGIVAGETFTPPWAK